MTRPRLDWTDELERWLEPFLDALGHSTRRRMCPVYVAGLIGPGDRKSVQPMAARDNGVNYDQLHHFIASSVWDAAPLEAALLAEADKLVGGEDAWLIIDDIALPKNGHNSVGVAPQYASALGKTANCQSLVSVTLASREVSDDTVLAAVRARILPLIAKRGPIRALIIDDTGMPKKGRRSVGVARQYYWQLGKQDNCQVAVSLSAANDHGSLPIAYQLYLLRDWADDPERRAAADVPDEIVFQTKPQIALDQLRATVAAGVQAETVLADAGYGNDTDFRDGITEIGLPYVVGITSTTSLWPPGKGPLPPKPRRGQAAPPRRSFVIRRISLSGHRRWRWNFQKKHLAAGDLAGRQQHQTHLALRCRAGAPGASRL